DYADDVIAKVREYLRGGVRLAWIVYPLSQEIHAYWPGANSIRVYGDGDELDAGDILPGFRTPVSALFPPLEPPPPRVPAPPAARPSLPFPTGRARLRRPLSLSPSRTRPIPEASYRYPPSRSGALSCAC